jgi:2-methylfumaryl-CoA isomerase
MSANATGAATSVSGPYYEELEVGQVFDASPSLTLSDGHAALHQAIVGDRLRLALDSELCRRVVGGPAPLAHPALVCDVAIGQSTIATQRVIANLFYRGLVLHRAPAIGDTLRTTTEVVALRDTSQRPDRPATGLAALRVRTVDQAGRDVLDFHRCAMLPMRNEASRPGHAGDLDEISAELPEDVLSASVAGWDLGAYRSLVVGGGAQRPLSGTTYVVEGGDTVSCAPELARLSLNVATAHHDPAAGGRGRRLVYGGHTIGLALRSPRARVRGRRAAQRRPRRGRRAARARRRARRLAREYRCRAGHRRGRSSGARLAARGAGRMKGILDGLNVLEGSAFVAAPLGGMTLAQLGADVIRFDQIGGGLDQTRWPLAADGQSLFWAGLNKGKRSIQVDLHSAEGRELVTALVEATGTLLTNFPARGWLSYETLRAEREDLVMVSLNGNPDGTSEVDYTVNPATGFPWATGPRNLAEPLNSVLPAWDVAMGTLAAVGLLAAERHRERSGDGQLVRLALSDVAFAMVGNLGRIAEAQLGGQDQRKDGNYLYGAFGHDFPTSDGRRVMVVALTARQWRGLVEATGTGEAFASIERATGHDLVTETGRYEARDLIAAILRPWFEQRSLAEIRLAFSGTGVSWGPYQTFRQLAEEDSRCSTANPMFDEIEHPGVGTYLAPRSPLDFSRHGRLPVRRAPLHGAQTEEILAERLGLSPTEIGDLHDRGVVAGPNGSRAEFRRAA